jgi:hypothetical protein
MKNVPCLRGQAPACAVAALKQNNTAQSQCIARPLTRLNWA